DALPIWTTRMFFTCLDNSDLGNSVVYRVLSKYQQLRGRRDDTLRRHPGHAAMVDRTLAFEAGCAVNGFAHNARHRAQRTRGRFVGGSKDRDGGNAQRGGDVHSTGIVREKYAARSGHIDKVI